jgi:streptogramin lyase
MGFNDSQNIGTASLEIFEENLGLSSTDVLLGQPGTSYMYAKTFGETEIAYISDTTHINYPWGIGTDGSNIWIGELWGNRALKYNQTGIFQMQIGLSGFADIYDTVLFGITDVAVDSSGNVWIVDGDAHHIVKFDSLGNMIGELGSIWESGIGNDRFDQPQSIAFDTSGNIYISDGAPWWSADIGNHRVQIFDSDGNYLATIGQPGTCGTGNNQLCGPRHIAIYENQIYISDAGNHRVQIFNISTPTAPVYVNTIGTGEPGNLENQLYNPSGVAGDVDYIYIADTWNHRIQVFSRLALEYVTTVGVGWGSNNDQFKDPSDVAVDAMGYLYVADFVNTRVQQYSKSESNFTYSRTYGVTGVPYITDEEHYNRPTGIAVDGDGSIYITEDFGHRLVKLNTNGSPQWIVGAAGVKGDWDDDNYRLNNPADVALDASGKVYVADRWHGRVQIYNPNGSYFGTVSGFWCPGGVAIAPNGFLYVADSCESTIRIFDTNIAHVGTLGISGESGSDNMHFHWPEDVVVDGNGLIYVADTNNFRIQVFNSNLTYLRTMGETGVWGSDYGYFGEPNGLSVDNLNRLYVSDAGNDMIQVFDSTGAYLTSIGGQWGNYSGQVQAPQGVAVDTSGSVFIADWGNHRIQKYDLGVPNWQQVNINGFGKRWNVDILALEVFNKQLYASAANWDQGAQIWRTANGDDWVPVSVPGFASEYGNANPAMPDMIVFNDKLYAGTGWSGDPMQIWRTENGTDWEMVVDAGFGVQENSAVEAFAIFNNQIYATIQNTVTGVQIWRSSSADIGSWQRVIEGFNGDSNAYRSTGLEVYDGKLYAAIENGVDGTEIWATTNGVTWTQVNADGFGDKNNQVQGGFAVYKDELYIGTNNSISGGQVWKYNGTTWSQIVDDGFGDPHLESLIVFGDELYVGSGFGITGMKIWKLSGDLPEQINIDGFGDSNNYSSLWCNAQTVFNGYMYWGTWNQANGGEIWRYDLGSFPVYLPLGIK